jgi:hypothetical protein
MRPLHWLIGSLQAAVFVVVLAAAAQTRPADHGLDRGGLNQLATNSTRYLDPSTTGAIAKLINRPSRSTPS